MVIIFHLDVRFKRIVMQSYPARALDRKLKVDWARDAREGPRVLMNLRIDFEPMG